LERIKKVAGSEKQAPLFAGKNGSGEDHILGWGGRKEARGMALESITVQRGVPIVCGTHTRDRIECWRGKRGENIQKKGGGF